MVLNSTSMDWSTRSDQYAFCVALYEALHGKPPFSASTYPELLGGDDRRSHTTSEQHERAGAWRPSSRGLARDPAARWPSMTAPRCARREFAARRRMGIGVAVLVVVGVAAWRLQSRPTDLARVGGRRCGLESGRAGEARACVRGDRRKGPVIATDVA
jgi:hypothetical protein